MARQLFLRIVVIFISLFISSSATFAQEENPNLIVNGSFEAAQLERDAFDDWKFQTLKKSGTVFVAATWDGKHALKAVTEIARPNNRHKVQIMQKLEPLKKDEWFVLTFRAWSPTGSELRAIIQEHKTGFLRVGPLEDIKLTECDSVYVFTFRSQRESDETFLDFQFAQDAGCIFLDQVSLFKVGDRRNLIKNGSFERFQDGLYSFAGWNQQNFPVAGTFLADSANATDGRQSAKAVVEKARSVAYALQLIQLLDAPLLEVQPYVLSLDAMALDSGHTVRIALEERVDSTFFNIGVDTTIVLDPGFAHFDFSFLAQRASDSTFLFIQFAKQVGCVNIDNVELRLSNGSVPVEMTSFTAAVVDKENVELSWATATESGNYGFEPQKSVDGGETFAKIGFVAGGGTTVVPRNYTYVDSALANGLYMYRLKQIDLNGASEYSSSVQADVTESGIVSGIDDAASLMPSEFALGNNYPNPFNPETAIEFALPTNSFVQLTIFNVRGQEVRTLVNRDMAAGHQAVRWDGRDSSGNPVSSGTYVYMIRAGDYTATRKMLLMK